MASPASSSSSSLTSTGSRDSSPELGLSHFKTQYSKKTGRPIRRSAGKVKPTAGFVDSKIIEDEEPIDTPSEDEDGYIKPQPKRKRKRSPSPEPPPLDDVIRTEEPDTLSEDEDKRSKPEPIVIQLNIPLGYHGPMKVELNRNMLGLEAAYDMRPEKAAKKTRSGFSNGKEKKKLEFADLPAELRNKMYRHLFVKDQPITFKGHQDSDHPQDYCRSAQFLRTCKLVHSEGCSVLYGENKFTFERNHETRGPFWQSIPSEIGYKDIRQFLRMIGPENLVYLRDVALWLDDAKPGNTKKLSHEERRYPVDQHLIDVLRTLRHAKLRKFNLMFLGRRSLTRSDIKFVDYLLQIKADEVTSGSPNSWHHQKIDARLWKDMKETMTRKKKLYLPEK